jgi:hypothetical protein
MKKAQSGQGWNNNEIELYNVPNNAKAKKLKNKDNIAFWLSFC